MCQFPVFAQDESASAALVQKSEKNFVINKHSKAVRIIDGTITYSWNYRSSLDSTLYNADLSQHLISAGFGVIILEKLPLRISYFGRETNSPFFKNYHDVRVDLDINQINRLRVQKIAADLQRQMSALREPIALIDLRNADINLQRLKTQISLPSMTKELIESKELLLRQHFKDTTAYFRDSVHRQAENFIHFYDSLQTVQRKLVSVKDSLQLVIQQNEQKLKQVENLIKDGRFDPDQLKALERLYNKQDDRFEKIKNVSKGIKTLALGRTFPSYSPLTLHNVSVNGANIEYEGVNFFVATAAGGVDFRIRDFLFNEGLKYENQYVWLTKAGYGKSDGNHIAVSYLTGRKQFLSSSQLAGAAFIQDVSLSGQIYLNRYTRVYGELAQSASPAIAGSPAKSSLFRLSDDSHKAYSLGMTAYLPATRTRFEGHFQNTGINYQCFNSFQYNADATSWFAKLEQSFWKRQLTITASARKNDFTNPFLLQRYNANTIFKTGLLTFQKANWPTLSVGYLPVSQNIIIENQLFENRFQALNGNLNYQYKIGEARTQTTFMYNRFYNEGTDSNFIYFNSQNVFWNQTFLFDLYSASIGASLMKNNQYNLAVLEGGITAMVFSKMQLDFGFKVNHLQNNLTRFGYKGGGKLVLKHVGEINLWAERSYLPTMQSNLYKYEIYNLGFTRFFH